MAKFPFFVPSVLACFLGGCTSVPLGTVDLVEGYYKGYLLKENLACKVKILERGSYLWVELKPQTNEDGVKEQWVTVDLMGNIQVGPKHLNYPRPITAKGVRIEGDILMARGEVPWGLGVSKVDITGAFMEERSILLLDFHGFGRVDLVLAD